MRMTRGVVVRYVSAGGRGLPSQAGWPFARLEVSGGEARTRLYRTGMVIPSSTPVEVRELTVEFGRRVRRTEVRFQLASPQTGVAIVEVEFHDRTRAQEVLAALREAGFEIDAAGAGQQT